MLGLASPAEPTSTLTLRDGRVFLLQKPARRVGNRLVFRTREGKTYSVESTEVRSTGAHPEPTPGPPRLDRHDSRALGAIARAERNRKGKRVEIAPRPQHRPSKKLPPPKPR